jgi:hypothetical protein
MALKKKIIIDATGVPADYHVVDGVNVSRSTNFTSAMVMSYYTEDAFKAGKSPLAMATAITLVGTPPDGTDSFRHAEKLLAQPEPADGADDPTLYAGTRNRYVFADAQIVPDAEKTIAS